MVFTQMTKERMRCLGDLQIVCCRLRLIQTQFVSPFIDLRNLGTSCMLHTAGTPVHGARPNAARLLQHGSRSRWCLGSYGHACQG